MDGDDGEDSCDEPAARSLYVELAAAFVRGRLAEARGLDDGPALEIGRRAGLKLHRFKRSAVLPRVRKVIGFLRGVAPRELLDVGSGRGAFLWPLLDTLSSVSVLAIDENVRAVADIAAVAAGGVTRLAASVMDARRVALAARSVDVVTILEVLEHLQEPEKAAREAVRVSRGFVVASVPSVPDENPEHLRLYDRRSLERLLLEAGAQRVSIEYVLNHMIAVARV